MRLRELLSFRERPVGYRDLRNRKHKLCDDVVSPFRPYWLDLLVQEIAKRESKIKGTTNPPTAASEVPSIAYCGRSAGLSLRASPICARGSCQGGAAQPPKRSSHDSNSEQGRMAFTSRKGGWDLLGNAPVLGLAHPDGCGGLQCTEATSLILRFRYSLASEVAA
jgi:hypothetical protein